LLPAGGVTLTVMDCPPPEPDPAPWSWSFGIIWPALVGEKISGPFSLTRYVPPPLTEPPPAIAPSKKADRSDPLAVPTLTAVFGKVLIESIKPFHVRQYLDKRGQQARSRANREKALLSHVFNKAREWGYTDAPNPCQGVKGFTEACRDRYVTDGEFAAVRKAAHPTVQDAMDLALLTGQRPADVLKIRREDLRDGALWIVQNKTGVNRAIEVTGELRQVIERITLRHCKRQGPCLIQDENGQPISRFTLRSRFDKARKVAGVNFQFRDIRAKTATDTGDLAHSQSLLGHKKRDMTEHHVRRHSGQRVKPLR
jgi:integrase